MSGQTFSGTYPNGAFLLNDPALQNPATFTGTVGGGLYGFGFPWTVNNSGTVTNAGGYAIDLEDGGSINNGIGGATAALISGAGGGICSDVGIGAALTVTNDGTVAGGNWYGIRMAEGGSVVNGSSAITTALISGEQSAIGAGGLNGVTGAVGTVANYGTVIGGAAAYGVRLSDGGSVVNGAGGATTALISGGVSGIAINSGTGTGTVRNYGTVLGGGEAGISVYEGSITNGAKGTPTALVSGGYLGIGIGGGTVTNYGTIASTLSSATYSAGIYLGADGTVTNFGTITGANGTAVSFYGGANRLVVETGSVLKGAVAGFAVGDTIDFVGVQANNKVFSNGTLTLENGSTPVATLALQGSFTTANFTLSSDGSFGTNVTADVSAPSDFNGDGMSDVLWQNDNAHDSGSGQTAIWLMDGVNPTAEDIITTVPTSWHVVATGDFYGTGDAAILWQNDDGQAGLWEMNGTNPTAETVFASPPVDWHVVTTGDFNGDGYSDVLWQFEDTAGADSQNGNVAIWEMNGASAIAAAVVAQPGPDWDVIATGDFNGDGKSDILWQYEDSQNASDPQNGNVAIWEMNGLTPIAEAVVAQPGPDWHVVGTGDFNGDGKADILWQYEDAANSSDPQNGNVAIWEMNGLTPIASAVVAQPGSAWHAIGTGDYDGSGRSDILWQNTNGQAAIWLMNGLTPTTESLFAAPPSSWHVIPP